MRLYDKICNHLDLLEEMKKAGVPDAFLKDCPEEELLNLSRKVNQMEAKEELAGMETEAVKYLVRDQEFLPCLLRLLREDVCGPVRISRLLAGAGDDILSESCHYEEIASVLADQQVKESRTYAYLKYFSSNPLSEAEKEYLIDGLDVLDYCCKTISIEELTEAERGLLLEPVVSHSFLRKMIQEREFWKRLEHPAYRTLLNDLSAYAGRGVTLRKKQAEELWQHTEEIQEGLKEILMHLPSHEIGNFLSLWLGNEALVYDLGKLKRLLTDVQPDMEVKFTRNQISYLNFLYGDMLEGVDLVLLSEAQKDLLIYGITHRKKHFLSIVKENFGDFCYLRPYHLLLDADTYERYLNVNTLNPKNLKESGQLWKISDADKKFLTREQYTFEELKLFSSASSRYIQLYHLLTYPKSDDRLRVIREAVGRECLPDNMEEEGFHQLGAMLSQKPISGWLSGEMGHVENLSYKQAVLLLSVWDQVERFIPKIQTGHQADFLLHNLKALQDIPDFQTAAEQMPEMDSTWKELNTMLKIKEDFLAKNRGGIKHFLYGGGAEIFHAFLSGMSETEWEKARRLCVAEIAGRFREVKYYKNDLDREIALQLSDEIRESWMKNTEARRGSLKFWEEDRLLPVMQIGESLGHTCLSYRNGEYKACLLSCFDANKKVVYVSANGSLVFRAMLRLTKGAFSRMAGKKQELTFADIMQEEAEDEAENNKREYLTLFLERPYFKGISEDKEKEVVWLTVQVLQKKAKQLQAELILSDSYKRFVLEEKKFIRAQYYMYISASKNGKQYLDSLGGMAGVSEEGSYEKGYFLLQESFVNPKTDRQ